MREVFDCSLNDEIPNSLPSLLVNWPQSLLFRCWRIMNFVLSCGVVPCHSRNADQGTMNIDRIKLSRSRVPEGIEPPVFTKVGPLETPNFVTFFIPGYLGLVVLQAVNLRAAGHAIEKGVLMADGEAD